MKKKKGVLAKSDEGKNLSYQYGDDSTYKSEQRVCRFPHLPSNRDITEVAEGSAQQVWSEQRVCRFPPSVETEAVSASRKTHTIHQTSLNRGPDHPTFTRIDAGSFSQKAQMRRAVHPFSAT